MPDGAINGLTAPDTTYTPTSTIDAGREVSHVVVDVANQPIYRQLKIIAPGQPPNGGDWQPPVVQNPGSRVIDRAGLSGIRFWAFTPAAQLPAGSSQAVVTVEVVALNG